jgi:undecaprenyl-diphosphatase
VALAAAQHISTLQALVLGVVQGLTEFLPVSSSGHLILVRWVAGWEELTAAANADFNKTFDVAVHMGTFVGAAAYFAPDLAGLLAAGWTSVRRRAVRTSRERLAWLLLLSAVPGAVVGATLESLIQDQLGQVWLVAVMLVAFGLVLLVVDRMEGTREVEDFRFRDAAVMGVCQAVALQPGVSRSGVTITSGLWLGFGRDAAARLSFLMSLPIIGGAGVFKGAEVVAQGGLPPGVGAAFTWGMLSSAVTGFAAVWLVLRVVRTRSFAPFVAYRVVAGLAVLGLLLSPVR